MLMLARMKNEETNVFMKKDKMMLIVKVAKRRCMKTMDHGSSRVSIGKLVTIIQKLLSL